MDHGPGGRARQFGRDAHQMSAQFIPVLLSRMRTGADGVDTQKCRRPVRPRLLCHIIFETVFSRHSEVNWTQTIIVVFYTVRINTIFIPVKLQIKQGYILNIDEYIYFIYKNRQYVRTYIIHHTCLRTHHLIQFLSSICFK